MKVNIMKTTNLLAIGAFLTGKLNAELTSIHASTALKQWAHGDNAPVIATFQALTGQTIAKRTVKQTVSEYRANLVNALKTASGKDDIKARLHALGETLENVTIETDFIALAGNVPELIKAHIAQCKAERATRKSEKQSEAVTLSPNVASEADTVSPDAAPTVTQTPTIEAIITAMRNGAYTALELATLKDALFTEYATA